MGLIWLLVILFIASLAIFGPIAYLIMRLDEFFPIIQLLRVYIEFVTTFCVGAIIGSVIMAFVT